ncbi:cortex morphogenetic protein CmpA [Hazenella sp. IB182357]|uniref:Cortex morphogenetic protein CmpA n=1 Tax=Polycladospora coralii TaxID=2771432 RepID=A0A926N6K7_9BACL|nr:cortex morphogenetic protein CmpA [Polycladospora coralii]MBD1372296.1 cortex morphogenetic protein CmpA [Polycladospora coralii]MBS7531514.1 cortex morphogenetic protein CmpA [Polycladospora coralii]
MPIWMLKQLQRAFQYKDRKQIRFLNACWFNYQDKHLS